MHGYELRKQLNGVLGWGRVLSYGSLYPALKKMLRAGLDHRARLAPPGARSAASAAGSGSSTSSPRRATSGSPS